MSIGQFEECLEARYLPTGQLFVRNGTENAILGQYCLVRIPLERHIRDKVKDGRYNIEEYQQHSGLHAFEMGVCVPHTCKPEQIDVLLKESIENLFLYKIDKNIVSEKYCSRESPTKLRAIDVIAM